ncbi:MAG: hypothetical protein ACLGGX_12565 [Bdellovibrionia bacterium]
MGNSLKFIRTPTSKALDLNLDPAIYGAFAEIGAGQEVARFFFLAGKASQTIAKTISAYDMIVSDEIYGKEENGRYVCESRVKKMLSHEYDLLVSRLQQSRGQKTKFFAFADTVATASPQSGKQSHGWLGVRFQAECGGPFNDVILHVRMRDNYRLLQQEALGVLGLNLIHTVYFHLHQKEHFLDHLVEGLKENQIVIDVIHFEGPALKDYDDRLMNLELVRRGLAEAVLFSPQGQILNIADAVYKKNLLIQRGTFRPVTVTHMDVQNKSLMHMKSDLAHQGRTETNQILPMMELTMHNLQTDGHINEKDFLTRLQALWALDQHVLISNFFLFYGLKNFLRRYNSEYMALVVGANHLQKLFSENHYSSLAGGMLEGLGKLLDKNTTLYIYPHKSPQMCLTTKSFFPEPELSHLYKHFLSNQQIVDISGCDEAGEYYLAADVMKMITNKNPQWKKLVPEKIHSYIENTYGN